MKTLAERQTMSDSEPREPLALTIRDLQHRDIRSAVIISRRSFDNPWKADDFVHVLSRPRRYGVVAIVGKHKIVGFFIGEALRYSCQILSMAVHPSWRRRRVGTYMLGWLQDSIIKTERCRIGVEIRETNLGAQLFLKACGLRATEVMREYYEDTGEDAFRFEKQLVIPTMPGPIDLPD